MISRAGIGNSASNIRVLRNDGRDHEHGGDGRAVLQEDASCPLRTRGGRISPPTAPLDPEHGGTHFSVHPVHRDPPLIGASRRPFQASWRRHANGSGMRRSKEDA